jgi:hypothetical protein
MTLLIPGNQSDTVSVLMGMKTESPRVLARLAGVFFLLTILGGITAQALISERLINFGDARNKSRSNASQHF